MAKYYFILFFVWIHLITLTSCCREGEKRDKKCLTWEERDVINLLNFKEEEVDTLLLSKYIQNANFSSRTDSTFFYLSSHPSLSDTRTLSLPNSIDVQYDWEIKLISTGAIYRLTDFIIKKTSCGGCLFGHEYYDKLESYKVNGIVQSDPIITIRK